jgi:hypothetical protein
MESEGDVTPPGERRFRYIPLVARGPWRRTEAEARGDAL